MRDHALHWLHACLETVCHLNQESLVLWLEAIVSVDHQRIMIQNLLKHCWTKGLSFWKAIRPQSFFMLFFCPAALWYLVFLDSTQKKLSASRHHLQTKGKRHWSISQTLSGISYLFRSFLSETNKTKKGQKRCTYTLTYWSRCLIIPLVVLLWKWWSQQGFSNIFAE